MKVFIILAICIASAFAYTAKTRDEVRGYYDNCGVEHSVEAERLAQFKAGTFEHDELSKHFLLCLAHKIGLIDEHDHIVEDHMVAQLKIYNPTKTSEELLGYIQKCNEDKTGKHVLKAFSCMRKEGLKTTYSELFA